jgi:hypothetical protein
MNAYQQRLSLDTRQKIFEIDGVAGHGRQHAKWAFDEVRPEKSKHNGEARATQRHDESYA